ncbi:MAG TPA: 2OG-Fe(II) oxygenase [Polyangia bacterium]|nr:2OG-Fe(II) oxygenase [Polyangia bacterium]
MSTQIRFLPELARWVTQGLDNGVAAEALVKTMIDEKMQPEVATAIVGAFMDARRGERPLPVDTITVAEELTAPVAAGSFLLPGPRLASDRSVRVLTRNDNPVLALLDGIVTPDECAELIALARPRLLPSTVVDPDSGKDVVAAYRTSLGMFFRPGENPLVARLDRRFSEVMNLPLENGEGLQVLRYEPGAGSAPHHDYLAPTNPANQASLARSGQRVSTVVTYLNDVEAGGETTFPLAGWSVTPHRGTSLYFESCDRLGRVDQRTLHASNPVTAGEKWVATKWMRQRRFVPAGN